MMKTYRRHNLLNMSRTLYPAWSHPALIVLILTINFVIINTIAIYSDAARTRLKNTLKVKYNVDCHLPQCTTSNPNVSAVNLFQVISTNPETPFKTNYIWSNIGGPPMIISTTSSQDSDLLVDWESIINPAASTKVDHKLANTNESTENAVHQHSSPPSDGLHFNVVQDAAIGLLVEKIVFFDDKDKSGLFTRDKPHVEIDWSQVIWDSAVRTIYEKDDFIKSYLRMKQSRKVMGGNILMKLAIPRNYKADRQQELPKLKMNGQSISVVVVSPGLKPPVTFMNPRLAMTFVVVVQSPSTQVSVDTDSESLISDEYTPGVFRIKSVQFKTKQEAISSPAPEGRANPYVDVEGLTPEAKAALTGLTTSTDQSKLSPFFDKSKLGFLYWKEVAYTERGKIISPTVDIYDNEIPMPMETLPNISQPFYQYFKYQPTVGPKPQYKLYRFEMIFGKGESTYGSTNFTEFSFVFGLGPAPQERAFSLLVKTIIFTCFCLPLMVMLAGLGYLLLRRFRRGGDTELLLAAES